MSSKYSRVIRHCSSDGVTLRAPVFKPTGEFGDNLTIVLVWLSGPLSRAGLAYRLCSWVLLQSDQFAQVMGSVSRGYHLSLMDLILFWGHHKAILPKLFVMGPHDGFTGVKQLQDPSD
ncbi:hypothetical protein Nepgr_001925 [Nepenthes gracilis]|uniref:Uncharacterized protein n=1 Tax=Nepenthes gracilis TaxID=150966 RepID=A0AAD3P5C9_NEPGR|nr:hypothetical protein Nepgr_001925 [Nepenthes gracilis]